MVRSGIKVMKRMNVEIVETLKRQLRLFDGVFRGEAVDVVEDVALQLSKFHDPLAVVGDFGF